MQAQQEKYIPQAGSGTDTSAGESRPLTASAERGCPSYSGGGNVLLKWEKPFSRSGLLKRTPPKTTTRIHTRTETEHTETEDGISTGDEGTQCRQVPYESPQTFFSPMVSTPRNRAEWKRKKSPTNKDTESLEDKEDRLMEGLLHNIVAVNSLVDRQGPYKNTANEVKTKLRELQKLCGRVMDVRRMRAGKKEEEQENTPKRFRRAVMMEEKGTNTSTGGEIEGLEGDDLIATETDWKEVRPKSKRQPKEKKKIDKTGKNTQVKVKGNDLHIKKYNSKNIKNIRDEVEVSEKKENTLGRNRSRKKPLARPEALLVEVKDRDYASVLKEVKSKLASDEVTFSKVRKTKKGDILLELDKSQNGSVMQIKEKVGELCPSLTLRTLKETADIIIKGLDVTVEKEEVEESLKQNVKEFRIKKNWDNHYGNKIVIVELSKEEALKLVEQKKIKIGWLIVTVGLSIEKKRCYRCLEYGHISTGCPGQDRSRRCYNCGTEGHIAKNCKKDTACAICQDKGLAKTDHQMGSRNCPSWKLKVPGRKKEGPKNGEQEQEMEL